MTPIIIVYRWYGPLREYYEIYAGLYLFVYWVTGLLGFLPFILLLSHGLSHSSMAARVVLSEILLIIFGSVCIQI